MIPKRGSEEQISDFRFVPKLFVGWFQRGDLRNSWFRNNTKLFVEQFNRHFNLREGINRKNATFDT